VRAAVAALTGTVAEPLVDDAVELTGGRLRLGAPISATRIAGLDASGTHVVNQRYAAEHPGLLAGAIAHELLVAGPAANNVEEVLGHGVLAMVQMQLVARAPRIAHTGTELARRQSSFVITLFNSRPLGSPFLRFRCPDGFGTIPGGAPALQSPDFASIPFTSAADPAEAEPAVRAVLEGLVDGDLPDPLALDDGALDWIDEHLGTAWLPMVARVRVGVALGLVSLDEIVEATGLDDTEAVERFHLAQALEPFV
jgi:hypothetical protein